MEKREDEMLSLCNHRCEWYQSVSASRHGHLSFRGSGLQAGIRRISTFCHCFYV